MGRLRVLSGLGVCQVLVQNGFASVRQRGSRRIMQGNLETTTVTVPVPLQYPIRRGAPLKHYHYAHQWLSTSGASTVRS